MIHKRNVIFFINSGNQFSSQFHENTKIKMLKSYFKDISHLEKFAFIYKSNSNLSDDLTIKELTQSKEVFLRIIKESVDSHQKISNIEEILIENENLKKQILELNNKYSLITLESSDEPQAFKKYKDMYEALLKKVDDLTKTNQILNEENNFLKIKIESFEKNYRRNSPINRKSHFKKVQPSEESRVQTLENFSIKKVPMEIQEKILNTERNESEGKSSSFKIRKNKQSFFSKNVETRKKEEQIQIENRFEEKKVSNDVQNVDILPKNNKNGIKEEIKESKIESNKLGIKQNEPIQEKTNYSKILNYNIDTQRIWSNVLQFLRKNEIINFSTISKNNLRFYLNYTEKKIILRKEQLEGDINDKNQKLKENKFEISQMTISALKILDKRNALEIFVTDHTIEDSTIVLYRILAEILNFLPNTQNLNDDDFKSELKSHFNVKCTQQPSFSLGPYFRDLIDSADFSEIKVINLRKIIKKYKIERFVCTEFGKICKICGTISFLVKDILMYTGIFLEETDKTLQAHRSRDRLLVSNKINELKVQSDINKVILDKLQNMKRIYDFNI